MYAIFIIFLIIFIIIVLCEIDRNSMIKYTLYDYYIEGFPKKILFGIHNTIYRMYNNQYTFDPSILKFNDFLKKNKNKIKENYLNSNKNIEVIAHTTSNMLEKDNDYKYINFQFCGKPNINNLKEFPIINELLRNNKEIQTCFFSIMKAKKEIPYHRGPYSGYLRYHLPIIIKPNTSYIQIFDKKIDNKKEILFDDTYPHKLVKTDDSLRVVLICDIENPYSLFYPHKLFNI